jgi:hypothetical protein
VTQAAPGSPALVVGLVPLPVGAPPGQGPPQTTPSLAGSESSAGISESASGAGTAVGSDSVVDESESESELGGHGGAAAGVGRSTTATAPLPQALESDAGSTGSADPDHSSAATSTGSLSLRGSGSESGGANTNSLQSRSAFAADVASSVVTALLSLASRAPLVGPCAGVLQDIFAMHGVSARSCWCQCHWQWSAVSLCRLSPFTSSLLVPELSSSYCETQSCSTSLAQTTALHRDGGDSLFAMKAKQSKASLCIRRRPRPSRRSLPASPFASNSWQPCGCGCWKPLTVLACCQPSLRLPTRLLLVSLRLPQCLRLCKLLGWLLVLHCRQQLPLLAPTGCPPSTPCCKSQAMLSRCVYARRARAPCRPAVPSFFP